MRAAMPYIRNEGASASCANLIVIFMMYTRDFIRIAPGGFSGPNQFPNLKKHLQSKRKKTTEKHERSVRVIL